MAMKAVLHSFTYAIDYLAQQVADVSAADMVTQPSGILNHPAWTIGHLTLSCQMLGEVIGVQGWLPTDWVRRFGPGSVPVADAAVYETKRRAVSILRDAQERLARAVESLDNATLDLQFPVETYRDVFPTIRHALTQVMVGHAAYHVGQMAIWRRAMGLPPLERSFQ